MDHRVEPNLLLLLSVHLASGSESGPDTEDALVKEKLSLLDEKMSPILSQYLQMIVNKEGDIEVLKTKTIFVLKINAHLLCSPIKAVRDRVLLNSS